MPYIYDPLKVSLVFGTVTAEGFAAGSMIVATRNNDSIQRFAGGTGNQTITRNADRSGMITVNLQQTSPTNDAFSIIHNIFETSDAPIVLPVSLSDGYGTTVINGAKAWLTKPADKDFGDADNISTSTWVIEVAEMNVFNGGNIEAATE